MATVPLTEVVGNGGQETGVSHDDDDGDDAGVAQQQTCAKKASDAMLA